MANKADSDSGSLYEYGHVVNLLIDKAVVYVLASIFHLTNTELNANVSVLTHCCLAGVMFGMFSTLVWGVSM